MSLLERREMARIVANARALAGVGITRRVESEGRVNAPRRERGLPGRLLYAPDVCVCVCVLSWDVGKG